MDTNRLFTAEMLAGLPPRGGWRVIAASLPGEVEPLDDPRHQAWLREHGHEHAHREVLVVLAGEGEHAAAGLSYRFGPGTVYLFDSYDRHDLECPPWRPDGTQLWLSILSDHCIGRLLHIRDGRFAFPFTWIQLLAWQEVGLPGPSWLFPSPSLPQPVRRLRIEAALAATLAALIRAGYQPTDTATDSFQAEVVESIRRHIEQTAGVGANLDHLARLSGYSKYHFLRLFRRHVGCPVHAYVDRCRVQRVRALRLRGVAKRRMAEELGFSCAASFSRWYSQHAGEIEA